ncbi:flagellar motor switch protein FliN/FliY [Halanaerobium congolense]|jgi:flagellar motor switch protein FliN/FliY|uniref:Flagellar motor switch protein FliN/FliY n=1 Tax=Halanaerobium congolense TaxID=54121 RepID=A0A1I0B114_9FIRM|nr:flagellar motor switch phosphatase FliY [Halanaerobium congolense]PTX16523.1 flagellar motor switch protein FliN/FliY [Halanaerobium congolense]SDF58745.1 flagellar motor switch protein FliN/FliY [Halanaerobium congolense]SET00330.1 flagellar motor switch protein FliN/FliY [Halanaerobium congolense]SFP36729.1 flagellar motor switch protein FliN/FliY [Halanaerobium congolense]
MTNEGNFLSQEEIDALMNNQDDEDNETEAKSVELTPDEIDVIGEVNNIAMGSSATALSKLLDQKVDITTPEVELMSFQKLIEDYDRPCVLVKVEYVEGIEGLSILVLNTEDAAVIADLMMGGDGLEGLESEMLNEISISAVGEAMNQMMGAASTSMSNILDRLVNISPPEAEFINLDDVMEEGRDWFDPKEEIVVTSFNLKIGDLIDSTFKQLSSYNFVKNLAESLLTGQTGLMDNSTDDSEEQPTAQKAAPKAEPEQTQAKTTSKDEAASKSTAANTSTAANSGSQQRRSSSRNISSEETVDVHSAQFPEFSEHETQPLPNNMELIKDVPLEVTVRLGKTVMKIRDILELGDGSIIELDKLAGEPVDLLVNGKLVAKGEVVVIDENFGFRVKDIVSPAERLNTL